MKELYETNKAFKNYVNKYATKHAISVEVALTHIMVAVAAAYFKEVG